jgi:uncharacterized protein YndB with AHSA1/START domain
MGQQGASRAPASETGMLIRKPPKVVFEAFIDPDVTTKFWFTKASRRLEAGRQVQWDWEMYDISIPVNVAVVDPNERIVIEWPGYSGQTTVEWTFDDRRDGTTFVTIRESGFVSRGDALIKEVADSTQGFTIVLAGAKALLEHGIRLNLVADRNAKGRPGTSGAE